MISPTRLNGKICYLEIPATDVETPQPPAEYGLVESGRRGDGATAFDDTIGAPRGSVIRAET